MDIIDRINMLRKEKNTSNMEIAELIGKTKSTISNWKNRTSKPTVEQIEILAKYFDTSTDFIITGKEKGISDKDNELLSKYKQADEGTRKAVDKLLDIQEDTQELLKLKIG